MPNRKQQQSIWAGLCLHVWIRGDDIVAWKYTKWRAPRSLLGRLLERRDEQISFLELGASAVALATFQESLRNEAFTMWIDNDGVLCSLIKGSAGPADFNPIIGRFWLQCGIINTAPQFARVPSAST